MKKYITGLCITVAFSLSGCSDWLDVDPVGQNLEEKQYSTEININNALNGIYVGMAGSNLYGGQLTMTTIEHLAHYYYAPASITNQIDYQRFFDLQNYKYNEVAVENLFRPIWRKSYELIFQANNFIENVKDTKVVTTDRRNVLLGEAYALRAFLHFDLFRIFGSIYDENDSQTRLPYNDSHKVNPARPHEPLTSKDFINKVLADIDEAETYLINDPILSVGIMNPNSLGGSVPAVEIFAYFSRGRRLNLIAVKALKARVLTYAGRLNQAAQTAQDIIDMPGVIESINGSNSDAIFRWVVFNDVNADDKKNMVFSSEVLFGIENQDLYSRWKSYTESTQNGSAYVVNIQNLLKNILNTTEASPHLVSDIRAKYQWTVSSSLGSDLYRSMKFTEFSNTKANLTYRLQPLMRISELYYIIIEDHIQNGRLTDAVNMMNSILRRRDYKSNEEIQANTTETSLKEILKQEYYREFFAEGQAFFYLKRNKSTTIYKSYGSGTDKIELSSYVVPLPKDEINN